MIVGESAKIDKKSRHEFLKTYDFYQFHFFFSYFES
jgi:hypothetical protein